MERPSLVIFRRTALPEGRDALRLEVEPRSGPHVESLSFHFPMAVADSAYLDHGNQRSAWDAGCRFDHPDPEDR